MKTLNRTKTISKKFIETGLNPDERNFYYNLLKEPRVNIISPDSSFSIKPGAIWGYFDGKGLFINRKVFQSNVLELKDRSDHLWAQVMDIGTICLIYYNKNYKPELSLWTVGYRTKQNKEYIFLLDTRDGSHHAATGKNLESLIKDDTEIYSEFKNYKGDNEEKLYVFLKRYNKKHKLNIAESKF